MRVDSAPGRGSTFHFTANFDLAPAAAVAGVLQTPRALEDLRILVVDDNATNRRILEEMLRSWHMKTTSAVGAEAAFTALQQAILANERFDAVVSDCQMPDIDGFSLARSIRHDKELTETPIVMLTSVERPDVADRCRRLGIDACLTKPVKHSDLLDALATLFGVSTRRAGDMQKAPSAAPARPLRILVAEDNVVNRKLVTTLLQKRGHDIVAVENGADAVAAVAGAGERWFDVILMDIQMPVMGGFEATAAIREHQHDVSHTPIVALTAHAMQGDRERCLAAGMDGYLSKPIDVAQLISTIERFGSEKEPPPSAGPRAETEHVADFDEEAALSYTGGDRGLLKEVVALFRAERTSTLRRIQKAIAKNDGAELRSAAHALKGSIATVGGLAGRQAAAELEAMGVSNVFDRAEEAFEILTKRIEGLDEAFDRAELLPPRSAPRPRKRRATRSKRSAS
jgi:CheY-like chemotaxis protein